MSSLKGYSLSRTFGESKTVTMSHPKRERGRVLSFYSKIDVYLSIGVLQVPAPVQNTSLRVARISKNHMD